ncbi:hypothetical protein NQ315_009380 [Exocentrus adspersus]|uniref:Peptidase M12B domain-containing protein n=1 Tax=Exocentrus adspersus TaxID=1586481 RepID=A0AAV8WFL3_9CUCU|nr:hypothetical protein NQ315_009380 [Exocentrus adspersus]
MFLQVLILHLTVCYLQNVFIASFDIEALHDYMTEPELVYYFKTVDPSLIPDYEIVYLPVVLPVKEAIRVFGEEDEEIDYKFSAFQSICSPKTVQGLIFLENSTLEVHPLTDRLQTLFKLREPLVESIFDEEVKMPHIVKRANLMTDFLYHDILPVSGNMWSDNEEINPIYDLTSNQINRYGWNSPEAASYRPAGGLTLELALFFDEAAYNIFSPHFNHDSKKLQDMLLAYVNGIQALYHHPSLGTMLELVLVRLDIMKQQPTAMPHYNGERGKLLDSFCSYQQKINPSDDSNPDHWDMALYVSGLDFYAYEKGRKSGVTMGLATVGGVCLDRYSCVIAEFGTTNIFGKPYPSAGFTSVYIAAHEIGHNLGMHHDSSGNSCPKDGYIMSPSRGTNGETQWSTCSAEIMTQLSWAKCLQDSGKSPKHLDHAHFLDTPGQIYTAKRQCELLLRDKAATILPHQELSTICYNLQCTTPHKSGYYFAGPALEGTQCGKGKYCYGGNCVSKQPPKPVKTIPGGWGPWKVGICNSGCIEKSVGYQKKHRFCNNPAPVNTDEGCEGPSVEFGLCNDNKICKAKKEGVVDFASERCKEFSKLLPELDPQGAGLQAPHEEARVWMGCAIFCKRADSGSYYTPRVELNDLGVSPYFPDGTWCHRESGMNYYCIQHHCLPENFKFTKSEIGGYEFPFADNAYPSPNIPQDVKDYFSLNSNGKPVKTTLNSGKQPREEDWEINDYIEIPDMYRKYSYEHENYV